MRTARLCRSNSKLVDDLTVAGNRVFEVLAVSEALYLCERQRVDAIVIAADIDDPGLAEAQLHHITIRVKGSAKDLIVLKAPIGVESVSLQVVAQQESRVHRSAFSSISADGFDWRGVGEFAGRRAGLFRQEFAGLDNDFIAVYFVALFLGLILILHYNHFSPLFVFW